MPDIRKHVPDVESNSNTGDDQNNNGYPRTLLLAKVITFAGIIGFVWFFRPWFHTVFYIMRYSPFGVLALGLPILLAIALFFAPPMPSRKDVDVPVIPLTISYKKFGVFAGLFTFLLVLGVIAGISGSVVEQRTMADNTMDNVEIVDEPPEMNAENPRIAPRAVSDTQTAGSLSYSQHAVGDSDIARAEDGSLVWSYPLQPDQFRNQFSGEQIGMVHADMTSMEDRDLQVYDEKSFEAGQNMRLWNNVEWQMKKEGGYWSQYYDDPYEFTYEGEGYMVYPKTGHEWHLTPVPHTTPTWDGVALVHQDGTVEHLSAEEAQERPELDGQRLYPLHNSKEYADSLDYREGIANTLPGWGEFENVVEPASMPSGVGNDQPFVVDMEGERMNYVYAMEPAGSGTGLSEIWFFDAETGEPVAYETGGDTVFGPDRAVGIARGTDTQTEWGEDGEAMAVEPILMTVDDNLYWHIKVTTSDQTDVVRNVFVDAQGGGEEDTVVMHSSTEVEEFIAGEIDEDDLLTGDEVEDVDVEEPSEEAQDDGIAYEIVIYDEDGEEIDRIPVETGQETMIDTDVETVEAGDSDDGG